MDTPPISISTYTRVFAVTTTAASFPLIYFFLDTDLAKNQIQKFRENPLHLATLATATVFSTISLLLTLVGPVIAKYTGSRAPTHPLLVNEPTVMMNFLGSLVFCFMMNIGALWLHKGTRSEILLLGSMFLYVVCLGRVVKPVFQFKLPEGLAMGLGMNLLKMKGDSVFKYGMLLCFLLLNVARIYLEDKFEAKWRKEALLKED